MRIRSRTSDTISPAVIEIPGAPVRKLHDGPVDDIHEPFVLVFLLDVLQMDIFAESPAEKVDLTAGKQLLPAAELRRHGEVEALNHMAAEPEHLYGFLLELDALGNDERTDFVGEDDQRFEHALPVKVDVDVLDERSVDFDDIGPHQQILSCSKSPCRRRRARP
jgi:hypothetical protein